MHRWDDIDIHINGRVHHLRRARLLGHLAEGAARDPERPRAGAGRRAPRAHRGAAGGDAARDARPGGRGRRRQQRGARVAEGRTSAPAWTSAPTASSGSARRAPSPLHLLLPAERARPLARARLPVRRRGVHLHRRDDGGGVAGGGAHGERRGGDDRLLRGAVQGGAGGAPARRQPLHLAAVPDGAVRALVRRAAGAAGRRRAHGALLGGLGHQARHGGRHRAGPGAAGGHATCRRRSPPTRTQRRPGVESLQRAAQASLEWFEATERYDDLEPLQFAFSLLTRSLRITHENLRSPRSGVRGAGGAVVRRQGRRGAGAGPPEPPALLHAVPAARPGARQPGRGLPDVPVHRGGRHAERLAPACTSAAGRSAARGW